MGNRLTGKVALITGGSGGIGKETARLMLEEGAKVALVDLDKEMLEEAVAELQELGEVIAIEADVSDEDDVAKYVEQTKEKFGSIDIFFNNAGIIGDVDFIDKQTLENFQKVLNVNLVGVFLGMKHVAQVMKEQKSGSIINTSSVDGLRGSPGLSPYSASKHGVVSLTKTGAIEFADDNIRVNSIHPSPVGGEMMEEVEAGLEKEGSQSAKDQLEAAIPLGKYAEATDIANLVLFLASDESKFVTGAQYRVDGGMGATQ